MASASCYPGTLIYPGAGKSPQVGHVRCAPRVPSIGPRPTSAPYHVQHHASASPASHVKRQMSEPRPEERRIGTPLRALSRRTQSAAPNCDEPPQYMNANRTQSAAPNCNEPPRYMNANYSWHARQPSTEPVAGTGSHSLCGSVGSIVTGSMVEAVSLRGRLSRAPQASVVTGADPLGGSMGNRPRQLTPNTSGVLTGSYPSLTAVPGPWAYPSSTAPASGGYPSTCEYSGHSHTIRPPRQPTPVAAGGSSAPTLSSNRQPVDNLIRSASRLGSGTSFEPPVLASGIHVGSLPLSGMHGSSVSTVPGSPSRLSHMSSATVTRHSRGGPAREIIQGVSMMGNPAQHVAPSPVNTPALSSGMISTPASPALHPSSRSIMPAGMIPFQFVHVGGTPAAVHTMSTSKLLGRPEQGETHCVEPCAQMPVASKAVRSYSAQSDPTIRLGESATGTDLVAEATYPIRSYSAQTDPSRPGACEVMAAPFGSFSASEPTRLGGEADSSFFSMPFRSISARSESVRIGDATEADRGISTSAITAILSEPSIQAQSARPTANGEIAASPQYEAGCLEDVHRIFRVVPWYNRGETEPGSETILDSSAAKLRACVANRGQLYTSHRTLAEALGLAGRSRVNGIDDVMHEELARNLDRECSVVCIRASGAASSSSSSLPSSAQLEPPRPSAASPALLPPPQKVPQWLRRRLAENFDNRDLSASQYYCSSAPSSASGGTVVVLVNCTHDMHKNTTDGGACASGICRPSRSPKQAPRVSKSSSSEPMTQFSYRLCLASETDPDVDEHENRQNRTALGATSEKDDAGQPVVVYRCDSSSEMEDLKWVLLRIRSLPGEGMPPSSPPSCSDIPAPTPGEPEIRNMGGTPWAAPAALPVRADKVGVAASGAARPSVGLLCLLRDELKGEYRQQIFSDAKKQCDAIDELLVYALNGLPPEFRTMRASEAFSLTIDSDDNAASSSSPAKKARLEDQDAQIAAGLEYQSKRARGDCTERSDTSGTLSPRQLLADDALARVQELREKTRAVEEFAQIIGDTTKRLEELPTAQRRSLMSRAEQVSEQILFR